MKSLIKFFTIILCIELIVSPITPTGVFVAKEVWADSCPPGLEFNSTLNRCLTTEQTADVMNAVSQCKLGDAACYRENAESAIKKKGAPDRKETGKGMKFVSSVAKIAAIAMPLTLSQILIAKDKRGPRCNSISLKIMVAAALALVIGDTLANMGHKKRIKEINEDWGKIVNPEDAAGDKDKVREISFEAQSEAFEMLARAEDSIVTAAEMKKKFFMIASVAYGAATAISLWEMLQGKLKKTAAVTSAGIASSLNPSVSGLAAAIKKFAVSEEKLEADIKSGIADMKIPDAAKVKDAAGKAVTTAFAAEQKTLEANAKAWIPAATAIETAAKANVALEPSAKATTAASKAVNAWNEHVQSKICVESIETASVDSIEKESLYASYLDTSFRRDIKEEIRLEYDIRNSSDFSSLLMNVSAYEGNTEISTEEFYSLNQTLNSAGLNTPDFFNTIKGTFIAALSNLNPIGNAHALVGEQDTVSPTQLEQMDGGSGGGSSGGYDPTSGGSGGGTSGGSTGGSSGSQSGGGTINSNAAKEYKEREAKGPDYLSIGLGIGIGAILQFAPGLRKKLITPGSRAIFSGLLMTLTALMAKHAGEQADASKNRADLLRQMKGEFNKTSGSLYTCKSEDRNDPSKPNCYCYTAEGQRNSNRSNSQVCQKLWNQKNYKPGQYNAMANARACVASGGQPDPSCKCKQAKTCMTVKIPKIQGFNVGTLGQINSAIDPVNGLNNGVASAATVDGTSLENRAAKMRDLIKNLENQKGMEDFAKNKDKREKALLAELQSASSRMPSNAMMGNMNSGSMPSNPAEAVKELEKEIEESAKGYSGDDFIAAPESGGEAEPEFSLSEDGAAAQSAELAEAMKQDLDYGGNDINQGSSTNIFEVLSNRYQRSGMRRLFDEEGKTKADEAAKSDITE